MISRQSSRLETLQLDKKASQLFHGKSVRCFRHAMLASDLQPRLPHTDKVTVSLFIWQAVIFFQQIGYLTCLFWWRHHRHFRN